MALVITVDYQRILIPGFVQNNKMAICRKKKLQGQGGHDPLSIHSHSFNSHLDDLIMR